MSCNFAWFHLKVNKITTKLFGFSVIYSVVGLYPHHSHLSKVVGVPKISVAEFFCFAPSKVATFASPWTSWTTWVIQPDYSASMCLWATVFAGETDQSLKQSAGTTNSDDEIAHQIELRFSSLHLLFSDQTNTWHFIISYFIPRLLSVFHQRRRWQTNCPTTRPCSFWRRPCDVKTRFSRLPTFFPGWVVAGYPQDGTTNPMETWQHTTNWKDFWKDFKTKALTFESGNSSRVDHIGLISTRNDLTVFAAFALQHLLVVYNSSIYTYITPTGVWPDRRVWGGGYADTPKTDPWPPKLQPKPHWE